MERYAAALSREIAARASDRPEGGISTIYFGGGTPTLMPPLMLSGVLRAVREAFSLREDCEISIEANPGTVGREALTLLRSAGFNRLSLGVQSFQPGELRRLGRVHTSVEASEAFSAAREAGFRNMSLDLMYGIPEQTPSSWRQTLFTALELSPEHMSLYSLTVEEGTPFSDMLASAASSFRGTTSKRICTRTPLCRA